MRAVANTEARVKEIVRKDGIGRRRDYIGSPGTVDNSPQAFLVERPYAGARINPHFHDVDQFQVVVPSPLSVLPWNTPLPGATRFDGTT